MGWKKNTPGCTANPNCGCAACKNETDLFNRANNADINAGSAVGWRVDAGTFAIDSNAVKISSSNAYAKCLTETDDMNIYHEASFPTAAADDNVRILLDYVDDQASFFVERGGTDAAVKCYTRSGGVDTLVEDIPAYPTGAIVSYVIWYDTNFDRVIIGGVSGSYYHVCTLSTPLTVPAAGIGTGSLTSSFIKVDNFTVRSVDPTLTNPDTNCIDLPQIGTNCADNYNQANEVRVVVSGIGGGVCGCTGLNSTYTLKFIGQAEINGLHSFGGASGQMVIWQYKFPSAVCGFNYLYAIAAQDPGPNYFWLVVLTQYHGRWDIGAGAGGGDAVQMESATQGTTLDCISTSNLLCTYVAGRSSPGTACTVTGARARVTVL